MLTQNVSSTPTSFNTIEKLNLDEAKQEGDDNNGDDDNGNADNVNDDDYDFRRASTSRNSDFEVGEFQQNVAGYDEFYYLVDTTIIDPSICHMQCIFYIF